MTRTPNSAIHDYCLACFGWGFNTVNNSTDYEDEHECVSCRGSGRRTKETNRWEASVHAGFEFAEAARFARLGR